MRKHILFIIILTLTSVFSLFAQNNYYYNKGYKYFEKKEYDSSIYNLNKSIDLNIEIENCNYYKGAIYLYKKQYDSSIYCFNKSLKDTFLFKNAKYHIGLCYYELNDLDKAKSIANQVDSNYLNIVYLNGLISIKQRNTEDGIIKFRKVISIGGNSSIISMAHSELGAALTLSFEEESLIECKKAFLSDFRDARLYRNRGWALYINGFHQEALSDFYTSYNLDSLNGDLVLDYIYRLNFELKLYNEALLSINKSIKRNPDWGGLYYKKARCLIELKRFDEAITEINIFNSKYSKNDALDSSSMYQFRKKDFKKIPKEYLSKLNFKR